MSLTVTQNCPFMSKLLLNIDAISKPFSTPKIKSQETLSVFANLPNYSEGYQYPQPQLKRDFSAGPDQGFQKLKLLKSCPLRKMFILLI